MAPPMMKAVGRSLFHSDRVRRKKRGEARIKMGKIEKMGKVERMQKMKGMKGLLKQGGMEESAKLAWKRKAVSLFLAVFVVGLALHMPIVAGAAAPKCKTLCQAALKATGNGGKIKYQSTSASDFGGFSVSDCEKVSSVMYICDEKEAYSICVAKASSKSNAAALLKTLKTYKSNNSSSDYLSDYSSDEQKVFKNAVCGKKGNYVWYIAMSTSKSVNKKGQTELKKKI